MHTLDQARQRFPDRVREYVEQLHRRSDPDARYATLLHLTEALARHVATLWNCEYALRPAPNTKIEPTLRASSSKGAAFGVLVGAIRTFSAHLKEPFALPELGQTVSERLPPACATASARVEIAYHGISAFEVPPRRVPAYADAEVARRTVGSINLLQFLDAITRLRNENAHQADRAHWPKDPVWYQFLVDNLEPAVIAVLHWPPVLGLLTNYEQVSVASPSTPLRSGQGFDTEVVRGLPQIMLPLGPQLVRSEIALAEGHWLASRTDLALTGILGQWADFPTTKMPSTAEARRLYRIDFVSRLVDDGRIDQAERAALVARQEDLGLTTAEASDVERQVWADLAKALGHAATAELDLPETAMAAAFVGDMPGVREQERTEILGRCFDHQRADIERLVLQSEVVEQSTVARLLGMDRVLVQAHIGHLVAAGKLRQLGAGSEDFQYYALVRPNRLAPLRAFLAEAGLRSDQFPKLNDALRRLLVVVFELLKNDGDLAAEDGTDLREIHDRLLMDVDASAPAQVSDPGAKSPAVAELVLLVNGNRFDLRSPTKTMAAVGDFCRDVPGFLASLPWRYGKKRYLAGAQPARVEGDGHEFSYPVAVRIGSGMAYFEGVTAREDVAYLLALFLQRIGQVAQVVGGPTVQLDAATLSELTADMVEVAPFGVCIVHVAKPEPGDPEDVDGEPDEVRHYLVGRTFAEYAGRLTKWLVDNGHVSEQRLPLTQGKSHALVSWKPFHNSGLPFDCPVCYKGIYIEAGLLSMEPLALAEEAFDHFLPVEVRETFALEPLTAALVPSAGAIDGSTEQAPLGRPRSGLANGFGLRLFGTEIRAGSVRELAAVVVTELQARGHLLDLQCGVAAGPKRYIISPSPFHPTGSAGEPRPFWYPHQVGGLYVEVNYGRAYFLELMIKLCQQYDPDVVRLRTDDAS